MYVNFRNKQEETIQFQIAAALQKYDADKIGAIGTTKEHNSLFWILYFFIFVFADFALGTGGARVTSTPNTIPFVVTENRMILGFININERSDPQLLLQPGILPGQCFAFEGSSGTIRIRLIRKIVITSVTLEHVHRNLVKDVESAPKHFEVIVNSVNVVLFYIAKYFYGDLQGLANEKDDNGVVLASFVYQIDGPSLQTFEIPKTKASKKSFEYVELHILSNYGHRKYTCVYRFRVHGIPTD